MKKIAIMALMVLLAAPAAAQMFQTVNPDQAHLLQADGPAQMYCPNCGMNLVTFYKTSHALTREDGGTHQYCSLHCLVDANSGNLDKARVVDITSLAFIPVTDAFYVVGSDVKGTMTMKSKYAFADKGAAQAFATKHGGQIMEFDAAATLAREALPVENQNIDKKRTMMAKKGRAIFDKMAGDAEVPPLRSIAEAKTWVKESGVCGPLADKQYQAVAIYLMRRESMAGHAADGPRIQVPEDAKCPVCGMFVAKYPKWAAMLKTADGRVFYFDGVKDMMKFYLQPEKFHVKVRTEDFVNVVVSDYYSLEPLDGTKAFYVVGSNVFGPMGNELIPLPNRKKAEAFLQDHFGERIYRFEEIDRKLVYWLDS
ncbi:hypothetical protein CSB20_03105 [bacterium DOLZORAL124_64_63]|nr:MAG: hypothetical protein CSB20_03105 [bacterium DOLZORAL124_64_63]